MKLHRIGCIALAFAIVVSPLPLAAQEIIGEVPLNGGVGTVLSETVIPGGETIVLDGGIAGPSLWYFDVGATFLKRSIGSDVVIAQRVNRNNFRDVKDERSSADFDFQFESGLRTTIGMTDGVRSYELTYMGLHDYISRLNLQTTTDQQPIISPFFNIGTIPPQMAAADSRTQVDYLYRANYHNLEVNMRQVIRDDGTRVVALSGFRFMVMQEEISFKQGPFGNPPPLNEFTRSRTDNNLLGFQIGGLVERNTSGIYVGMHGNLGLFANLAQVDLGNLVITSPDTVNILVPVAVAKKSEVAVAYMADFGVNVRANINRFTNVKLGYQVIMLGGLALAPDQLLPNLTTTSGPEVVTDGFVIYHGPHISMELVW